MTGSESPKSCNPNRDSLRKGSEGVRRWVRRWVRKSLAEVRNLAPFIGIRCEGGLKVGPEVDPKASEGGSEGSERGSENLRKKSKLYSLQALQLRNAT